MTPLPPEMLPTASFVSFSIFNFTVPNIIAWGSIIVLFLIASVVRLPKIFEPEEKDEVEVEKR